MALSDPEYPGYCVMNLPLNVHCNSPYISFNFKEAWSNLVLILFGITCFYHCLCSTILLNVVYHHGPQGIDVGIFGGGGVVVWYRFNHAGCTK